MIETLIAAAVLALGFALYAFFVEPFSIEFTRLDIPFPDLPDALDGMTICHITDIHAVHTGRLERKIGCMLSQVQADICAITGDTISYRSGLSALPMLFGNLHPRLGSFAVTGNGEYKSDVPITEFSEAMRQNGVRLLLNESVSLGENLHIIGVDDPHRKLDDVVKASEAAGDGFRLMLAHSPDILMRVSEGTADLILAGHTHGGQIRVPFLGALYLHTHHPLGIAMGYFSPDQLTEITKRPLPRTHLYVSRGLGGGRIRIRFMCRPEIALITLHKRPA